MPIDQRKNEILKQMWIISEKVDRGEEITKGEKSFYNTHFMTIVEYYHINNQYWQQKYRNIDGYKL